MKNTKPDAWRPTANSILRSLAATDKRHIFLTGVRGAGKSTLFAQLLRGPCVTTYAVKGEGVYLKFQETTIRVGAYDESLPGTENKMRPRPEGFAKGVGVLEHLARDESPWVGIDEVGYLETEDYQTALLHLMEQKRVLAVVRKQDTPFLRSLLSRQDALVVDLDGNDIGCVIMASGLGKRFGGNKLMAELGGRPMISWALEATQGVFARRVVVTRHESVRTLCGDVPVVLHDLPYRSDTVRLGLEALGNMDGCLFLPGDQPFVTRDSLFAMVLAAQNTDGIWQLGGASPVLFPKWAFEELKNLPQGKGGNVLVKQYGAKTLSAEEIELQDIDTKETLQELCNTDARKCRYKNA